jgi:hypothetical protein
LLFNTTEFAAFFTIVLGLYLAVGPRTRWQNGLLLVASYVFYGWWEPRQDAGARRRAHVPVILVGRAERTTDFDSPRGAELNAIIARHAGPAVSYLDPSAIFASEPPGSAKKLFRDTVHWTPEGHRIVAERLAGVIESDVLAKTRFNQ